MVVVEQTTYDFEGLKPTPYDRLTSLSLGFFKKILNFMENFRKKYFYSPQGKILPQKVSNLKKNILD